MVPGSWARASIQAIRIQAVGEEFSPLSILQQMASIALACLCSVRAHFPYKAKLIRSHPPANGNILKCLFHNSHSMGRQETVARSRILIENNINKLYKYNNSLDQT